MTRFFVPDPKELELSDHVGLASIPVLFDAQYRILEAENLYLTDRVFGAWPIRDGNDYRPKDEGLASTTIVALARRLHHFADWRLGRDARFHSTLDALTYDDVLAYEREQWLGQGPFQGRSISRRTAAVRADLATDFLLWAVHSGVRKGAFTPAPTRRAAMPWAVRSQRKPSSSNLKALSGIPNRAEIQAWLKALEVQRGVPKHLICLVMVETGIRLMEAVALQVDQWPTMEEVGKATKLGQVEMDLVLTVTKNSKIRTVKVPIRTALTVAYWVQSRKPGGRSWLADAYVDRYGEKRRPTNLFISDRPRAVGVPIRRHTVFDCFREVEPRPPGWHPHMARHAFACHFMMRELRIHAGKNKGDVDLWIEQGGVIAAESLRRLLGHESLETTRLYLNYLRLNANIAMLAGEFQDLLDGGGR